MKKITALISILFFSIQFFPQELNCLISVNRSQIQGTNEELYRKMQQDFYEFMNNRKWTNNVFTNNERIECQIQINLSEFNGIDKFKGEISVQSTRTIYNTNYKSTLLNYKEESPFEFYYSEGQSLEFSESTHLSNITSVLAFYAYIILGLDYDSYGLLGGTEYFQKAKQIMNNAQSDPDQNWRAFGGTGQNNRYYLIEHITSNDNSALRRFYYKYHRLGLDVMSEKIEQGRLEISNAFKLMQEVFKRRPDSYFLKVVINSKDDEIANIFSEAPQQQKTLVYNILKEIDPTNTAFEKIMQTSD
jgi:hypothetical protein